MFHYNGNLTQQAVTKGSAPSMTLNVNPANNRVTGTGNSYDAAGNLTSTLYGGNMTYDLASRLASVQGMSVLRYTARNERLVVNKSDGTREVHMRGLGGEMIGVYRIDWENGNSMYTKPVRLPEREQVHVAGRLLFEGGKFVATDRLGSVAYKFGTGLAVQNGGFETGVMAPWAPYGGAQHTITMTPHSGSYALRQTIATTEGGAYQDVKGLVTGMSYQFRAWVRSETGLVNGSLAVSDTVGNNIAWTGVQSISNTWREFLVTFTATSQGIARIHLVKWDTTGALLWDDVELVNGATATSGLKMRYYPYGQEVGTATPNDVAKFGTYTRDSGSGLDYAMNRYYMSTWGRFTTADPYRASGGPANPSSWNRYAYVGGDPMNYGDPSGLLASPMQWGDWAQFQCFNMAAGLGGFEWAAYVCLGSGGGGGGRSDGVETSGGGSGRIRSANYTMAAGAWERAQQWIQDHQFKKDCARVMKALKISEQDWRGAIGAMLFVDGTTSNYLMADLFISGHPAVSALGTQYGTQTVADYLSKQIAGGKPAAAVASLGAPVVYLDYRNIDYADVYGNIANVMHEALHNMTGLTDPLLQNRLSPLKVRVGGPSSNISDAIKRNCL